MKLKQSLLVTAAILACLSTVRAKEYNMDAGLFGTLALDLPKTAEAKKMKATGNVVDYHFTNEDSVLITSFMFGTAEKFQDKAMRLMVQQTGESFLESAVESEIQVVALKLKRGMAYHFSVTDKAPKPDEAKFMTQGIARADGVAVSFTILHNDESMKTKEMWLKSLTSLSHSSAPSTAPCFDTIRLKKSDMKGVAEFLAEPFFSSIQTAILFNNPELYAGLMPKCVAKEFQSVVHGGEKGSILYFKYESELDSKASEFLDGLLYGEAGQPTKEHPETYEVKGDVLVVYSFGRQNTLAEEWARATISPRL